MKRFAAAILLLIYFTVSTGFVVSVHWCMNKVDSIALGNAHSDECGKCGMHMEDNNGCCKDDVKVVKMQVDQKAPVTVAHDFSFASLLPSFSVYTEAPSFYTNHISYPLAHGPPLSKQDTFLRNCVFRI